MKKTQLEKIETALYNEGTSYPGISVARLASRTKTPKDNVRRRIFDLRNLGLTIYTNRKNGNSYYRLSA